MGTTVPFQCSMSRMPSFMPVKKLLHDLGLSYSLLFPARLRVQSDDKVHFFADPAAEWDWLELNHSGIMRPGSPERRRPHRLQQQRFRRRGSHRSTRQQTAEERLSAVKVVASMASERDTPHTGMLSHRGSAASSGTSTIPGLKNTLLCIILGTADDII